MLAFLVALAVQVAHDPRLVGDWAFVDAFVASPGSPLPPVPTCGTDFGISYAADGSWRSFSGEDRGTWRTDGDRLTELVTHETSQVDDREQRVRRRPTRYRMRWVDADRLNLAKGEAVHGLERCPVETTP